MPNPGSRYHPASVAQRPSSEHIHRNRPAWNAWAAEYVESGRRLWAEEPSWGIWNIPEAQLGALPPHLNGKATLEMGCGTGYISAWLARGGARPVGIDLSEAQLATAVTLQREFGIRFPVVQGDAEVLPFPDASFDVVISEYGAAIWCDPHRWIPEASRVLRSGGELVFLGNGTILMLCVPELEADDPADERLKRDYFGMHRFEWPDDDSVEFHLGYGDWIRLLRANDFEVLDLIEVRPPPGATTRIPFVTSEWARRWPSEEIWRARKLD
jgi:SAM-dependent methyltransferase